MFSCISIQRTAEFPEMMVAAVAAIAEAEVTEVVVVHAMVAAEEDANYNFNQRKTQEIAPAFFRHKKSTRMTVRVLLFL